MKAKIIGGFAAAALMVATFGSATAPHSQAAPGGDINGASGLVAAVVAVQHSLNGVYVLDSNFTNVTALNNVLNHSPILSQNNIHDIQVLSYNDFLNNNTVVVQDLLKNFLNSNNIVVGQVVGVSLLDGGNIAVFI